MLAKILSVAFLLAFCSIGYAGNVSPQVVNFIYQLDTPNVFDFSVNRENACGSVLYRVISPNESITARKMSLVTAAFIAAKKVEFHETGNCISDRMEVAWVKLVNN